MKMEHKEIRLIQLFLGRVKDFVNIVAYLLKARTVEPVKQPLLANGSETTLLLLVEGVAW
jgi:hypothetical protein